MITAPRDRHNRREHQEAGAGAATSIPFILT